MSRYFTTYWAAPPWDASAYGHADHAASNEFAARGVEPGDHVFVVHYRGRDVFLGARLVVERLVSRAEASAALVVGEDEVWDARDHILADRRQTQRLDAKRIIPHNVLRRLTFLADAGTENRLAFDSDGAANQQTLRSVCELTPSSSAMLEDLIGWDGAPQTPQVLAMLLSRGPCFGTCPVYTFTLLGDGFATWQGDSFIDRVGAHVGDVTASVFAELASFAVDGGFFALEEEYPPSGTDLPAFEIVVGTGMRDKVVRAWEGNEPAAFAELAERLDRVAEHITWRPPEASDTTPGRLRRLEEGRPSQDSLSGRGSSDETIVRPSSLRTCSASRADSRRFRSPMPATTVSCSKSLPRRLVRAVVNVAVGELAGLMVTGSWRRRCSGSGRVCCRGDAWVVGASLGGSPLRNQPSRQTLLVKRRPSAVPSPP